VLLAAFVRRSLRRPEPMLDVRLLAGPRFRGGVVAALSSMVAMGGLLLLGVQWLQLGEGLSPLQSGLVMLPMALTSVVSSLVVPRLAERVGEREAITGGLLVAAAGMAVPVLAPGGLTIAALAVAFGVVGLGMGSLSVASGVIMSGTPVEKAGSAAALEETSYELGQALSVAVLGSIGLAVYRAGLPSGAGDAARESLASAGGVPGAVDAFADGLQVAGVAGAIVLLVAAAATWRLVGGGAALRARARSLGAVG
jgi:DHA2 family multidrug resistance protein-like MFS transporter